jgi:phosphoglycerate dehydrogenase-like enzyme
MNNPTSFLHMAKAKPSAALWTDTFKHALDPIGDLTLIGNAQQMEPEAIADHIRKHPVLITGWGSIQIPDAVIQDPGELKYICHLNGGLKEVITQDFFNTQIPVTNWGNAPAFEVAEGSLTLLLACLKNLRGQIHDKQSGQWNDNFHGPALLGGSLRGLRIGLYGFGAIARRFAEMLQPFNPIITAYDPYVTDYPDYVQSVDSLETLFETAHAISVHVGINGKTRQSITADLLAKLPDHGIIVNTARGKIIDQTALFKELESGRLRAGLDVLDDPNEGDQLPTGHPARQWPNLILSAHAISINHWPIQMSEPYCPLQTFHEYALQNLNRFIHGQPLQNLITEDMFLRMT